MKTKFLVFNSFLITSTIALVSCGSNKNESYTILAPQGAPTLAIYEQIIDGNVETTSVTTDIAAKMQLSTGPEFVIFDSINALNLIYNAKSANYTYLKMLTIGNFYLVGISKDDGANPIAGERVISFSQGGVTDETFKYLYPELYDDGNTIEYVTSVSDIAPIAQSGQYEGEAVDWVFFAQPALYSSMQLVNNDESLTHTLNPTYNVLDMVIEKSNEDLDFIPQAGLFVRNDFLEDNKEIVDEVLESVTSSMKNVRENSSDVYKTLSALDSETLSLFGSINLNMFSEDAYGDSVYKEFGIADPDEEITISDINYFLEYIGSTTTINEE